MCKLSFHVGKVIGGLEYPVCASTLISQAPCLVPELTMAAVPWTPQSFCLGNLRKILDLKQNPPFAVLPPQFGRGWHTLGVFPDSQGSRQGSGRWHQCLETPPGLGLCAPGAPQLGGHSLPLQQGPLKLFLLAAFLWEPWQPINLQVFVSLPGGSSSGVVLL